MTDNKDIYSSIESINFSNLLGAPLTACVDAQAQAASATADYIERMGFFYDEDKGKYKPINIYFRYKSQEGDKKITLPLISVVPVPYLQIKDVDLRFTANLSLDGEERRLVGVVSDQLEKKDGNTSSYSYSSDIKVNVNIKAGTADMPMGISRLLQIMQNNIKVINKQ